ncbi:MAG TPA: glycosyltransferase family 61 protein [Candidatus Saccharimonadales bacterium]|nr:glycosyltransferase family 61 protein [Candidatus Saccharimonadales bacterium]
MQNHLTKIWVLCFIIVSQIYTTRIKQVSVFDFIKEFPQATCLQCTHKYSFNMTPYPLYPQVDQNFFPSKGFFTDMFIMQVPQGTAYLHDGSGDVFLNNCFIKETQIKDMNYFAGPEFDIADISNIVTIPGRVAVISHIFPECYGHWIFDVLGQLALLEKHNIEYDYLCVPYHTKYMKEALDLWGIDRNKIIPLSQKLCIQADTIIMPTSVTQTEIRVGKNANYNVDFLLKHVSQKLLAGAMCSKNTHTFSEKVFISRKDAIRGRRVVSNEDEIFALFEPLGFKRYELTLLSLAQQIELFNNAKTIVSFVGSGSTNIIFCKPGTHYIEIVQKMVDATFFYVSDIFKLQYSFINNSTIPDLLYGHQHSQEDPFPLDKINFFLSQHPDL